MVARPPKQIRSALEGIEPGETILWEGKPEFWPFITLGFLHLLLFVPFSILWSGFSGFWLIQMVNANSVLGILFGLPFVLFGAYLVIGRFWVGMRCWQNTVYVVTDRRVLIRLGAFRPQTTSLDLAKISSVTLQTKRAGIGHVNFGKPPVFGTIYLWQPRPSWTISDWYVVTVPSFRSIKEPDKIYDLIRGIIHSGKQETRS